MLDIFALLLFAISCFKVKLFSTGYNDNYLDIKSSKSLRGLLVICVILHHLSLHTDGGVLFRSFERVGVLAVAVFFFLSGYGLQKTYIKNNEYKRLFILNRMPKIVFPYLIVTGVFWVFYAINGEIYSIKAILLAIINGTPIVDYSWYIISIAVFYLVFWILMIICGKNYNMMILGACIYYIIYVRFCIKMGYGNWWYISNYLLIIGMTWALYEQKILKIIQNHYWLYFSGVLILFVSLVICDKLFPNSIMVFFIEVFFVLGILLLRMKVSIENKLLEYIGNNSLEIYLIQGLFILRILPKMQNEFLYSLFSIVGSVVLGTFLHYITEKILKMYNKKLKQLSKSHVFTKIKV